VRYLLTRPFSEREFPDLELIDLCGFFDQLSYKILVNMSATHALNPDEFLPFELESVHEISHNTKLFRFKFPDQEQTAGLTICSCVLFKVEINSTTIIRPYTPVDEVTKKGHLDFVIKRYEEGNMSKYIHDSLKIGEKLLIKVILINLLLNLGTHSKIKL
jgi:NAD(P)H-flavin reductase